MAWLFALLLAVGVIPAALLGEVMRADSPRIVRAARVAFALLLGFDLLLAAVFFVIGQESVDAHMTRSLWWVTIGLAGVPLAFASGFAVRRGYTGGHRFALVAAAVTTAVLYLAFPLGFVPDGRPLTGLGRFEHGHHVLDVAILLIPTLILLADELGRKHEAAPDSASLRSYIAEVPRGYLVGAGVFLALLVWMTGTNGQGQLVGLGIVVAGGALWIWRKHRSEVRRVLRELNPPEKP